MGFCEDAREEWGQFVDYGLFDLVFDVLVGGGVAVRANVKAQEVLVAGGGVVGESKAGEGEDAEGSGEQEQYNKLFHGVVIDSFAGGKPWGDFLFF